MQGAPPLASPGLNLRFAAKTIGSGSLLAVPAAKERGDRGRWNYPSQATAAFEMVLSPGAGIASAAGGLPFWSPADPAFSLLSCPIPPPALAERSSPPGKGETIVISCKGLRPLHPRGLSRRGHGLNLRCRCHGGGRIRAALAVSAASGSFFQKRARAVAPSIKNREKFWGVWGTLSRVPQRCSRFPRFP